MDANEYALKVGPPSRSLGVVIRSAQWLGKGLAKPVTTTITEPCGRATAVLVVEESVEIPVAAEPPNASSSLEAAAAKAEIPPEPIMDAGVAQPPLPAQAIPDAARVDPTPAPKAVGTERELVVAYGPRRYRIRGLDKNLSYELLKVNVLVSCPALDGDGDAVHVDTLDLYQARHRAAFVKAAAVELGVTEEVIKGDLGRLLLALEAEQERLIAVAQASKAETSVRIEDKEREAALALLRRPDLIGCIASDFSRSGIVGETTNALVGYLAAVSRKLDRPLALLIQSTSAAGKSSLLDAVLRLVPEEDRVVYSAMTGQSLFYMGELNLKHKILAIAEEQGASRAAYALKLLQSEGELTIASTSKDPTTGKLVTEEYRVEGPVMIALTTTAAEIDEELLNRCLVLAVDEGRPQTQAIHVAQRERRTLAGLQAKVEREAILRRHQNAQRLLESLAIVNPYAKHLTFLDDRTRMRRDHEKYLTLIDTIALLHQHQRVLRTAMYGDSCVRYIEVTLDDIALANRLAHEVLGRTLDELPPQTRRLLGLVSDMVTAQCALQNLTRSQYRFSRRDIREHTRWGDTQLKIHLARLVELEYVLVHRGGRGQSFEYELLYDGKADAEERRVSGLIDVEALRHRYDAGRSGVIEPWSGSGRAEVGGQSVPGQPSDSAPNAVNPSALRSSPVTDAETARLRSPRPIPSYVATDLPPLAAAPA